MRVPKEVGFEDSTHPTSDPEARTPQPGVTDPGSAGATVRFLRHHQRHRLAADQQLHALVLDVDDGRLPDLVADGDDRARDDGAVAAGRADDAAEADLAGAGDVEHLPLELRGYGGSGGCASGGGSRSGHDLRGLLSGDLSD